MDEPKPLRKILEEKPGGFYTPERRAEQGDEKDQALHRRGIERQKQGLAGGVDGGSGRLREED
jgi:hypothetical protein